MAHTHQLTIGACTVRKRFVSWKEGEPDREWAALRMLDREVPGLAPRPLAREEEDGHPVIVMERVPGSPLEGEVSAERLDALSRSLRRLFRVPVPTHLEERSNGPSVMRRILSEWLATPQELGGCRDPALVEAAVEVARGWLDRNGRATEGIVDRVIALGDGNLDNVMWDGRDCRLIDFEEFGASDLTYELADVVEHASSRLAGRLDVEALVTSMHLDAVQQSRLEDHRRLMACFWLMMLCCPATEDSRAILPGRPSTRQRTS